MAICRKEKSLPGIADGVAETTTRLVTSVVSVTMGVARIAVAATLKRVLRARAEVFIFAIGAMDEAIC